MNAQSPARSPYPDFFILGAMKCGTSSLHHYLSLQDGICMSTTKEPNFFSKRRTFLHKGPQWYSSLFQGKGLKGESSTAYSKFPHIKDVPLRIQRKCPDAKFIYVVRDPIDRAISHVTHNMLEGLIPITDNIDQYLHPTLTNEYLVYGMYFLQLEQYLSHFNHDRFHVLTFEELIADPVKEVQNVLKFLSPELILTNTELSEKRNYSSDRKAIVDRKAYKRLLRQEKTGKVPQGTAEKTRVEMAKPYISAEKRKELKEFYTQDIAQLSNLIKRPLNYPK